jgi:hypothetical protein
MAAPISGGISLSLSRIAPREHGFEMFYVRREFGDLPFGKTSVPFSRIDIAPDSSASNNLRSAANSSTGVIEPSTCSRV